GADSVKGQSMTDILAMLSNNRFSDAQSQLGRQADGDADKLDHILCHLAAAKEESCPGTVSAPRVEESLRGSTDPLDQFWQGVKDSGSWEFAARASAGNVAASKFDAYLKANPAQKTEYGQCKGHAAKSNFRMKWAQAQYEERVAVRVRSQIEQHSIIKQGFYRSAGRIAVEEGGGTAGVRNATNYCIRCLDMGYPFVKFDGEFTQSARFLYVEDGFREEFTNLWAKHVTDKTTTKLDRPGGAAAQHAIGAAVITKTPAAVVPTGVAQAPPRHARRLQLHRQAVLVRQRVRQLRRLAPPMPQARRVAPLGERVAPMGQRLELQELDPMSKAVKEANTTKAQYNAAVGQANTLLKEVATAKEWERFNSPAMVGPLQTALTSLTATSSNPQFKDVPKMLTHDLTKYKAELIKKQGEESALAAFVNFKNLLSPLISACSVEAAALLASKDGADQALEAAEEAKKGAVGGRDKSASKR
ncbi:unnamed protein product, partial [Prorocentrum cordatum]